MLLWCSTIGTTSAFAKIGNNKTTANKIAIKELKKVKLLDKSEEDMVFRLLKTFSFIYVAGVITSVVDLARYIKSMIK